jgi:hypothetical protein
LLAPAGEGDALSAFFVDANGDVSGVICLVRIDLNVFFLERLEVSRASETCEACLDCVFVERVSLAERDAATKIFVRETLITAEIEAPDSVRRHGIEIEIYRGDVRGVVEG